MIVFWKHIFFTFTLGNVQNNVVRMFIQWSRIQLEGFEWNGNSGAFLFNGTCSPMKLFVELEAKSQATPFLYL